MIDWTKHKDNTVLAIQVYNELILPDIDLFNTPLLKHSYFTASQNDNIECHSYSIRSIQEKIDIYLLIDVEKNTNKIKVKNFTLTDFDSICLWCLLDNSEYKRNILIQHLKVIEKCIGEKYNTDWVDTIINHKELGVTEEEMIKLISHTFTIAGAKEIDKLNNDISKLIKELDSFSNLVLMALLRNTYSRRSRLVYWDELLNKTYKILKQRHDDAYTTLRGFGIMKPFLKKRKLKPLV